MLYAIRSHSLLPPEVHLLRVLLLADENGESALCGGAMPRDRTKKVADRRREEARPEIGVLWRGDPLAVDDGGAEAAGGEAE